MRRASWYGAGATIVAALEVAMCLAPAGSGATAERRSAGSGVARQAQGAALAAISYRGVHLRVPAGWPVHRLDADPRRCVRYDRNAVYFGRGGADQDCPARLTGRTETIHVEPIDPAGIGTPPARGDEQVEAAAEGEIRRALPAAGVMVTATYGARRAVVRRIVRTAWINPVMRVEPPARPPAPQLRSPHDRDRLGRGEGLLRGGIHRPSGADHGGHRGRRRAWATGRGFDTCTAPSLAAMRAWRRAYRIANIYIGGAARACADGNLSRVWIKEVRRMGYRLIPTYVGLQAPCTRHKRHFSARLAVRAGKAAADNAVRRARALGIGRPAPIYFDMEAYDSRKRWCRVAVLRFLHTWSRRLRVHHYTPGVYSSVASGIRDLGLARGIIKPSSIWFAHWDRRATTKRSRYLLASWWRGHRRIKQYRGPHRERHGGYVINIDSDVVDGRVY
ncbi:MAG TPA: glycoside hydrolase domain-containing protein [Streptosporangiaceae bacterium]|nr:glycoside hydrolase domain-containing protein [Streptosporangiaceae bacterium]